MYRGYFINLDRESSRRESLTRNLAEIGAASRYKRFSAIDGQTVASQYQTKLSPGQLGCWLSHLRVLESERNSDAHLHLVEDDVEFAQDSVALCEKALECALGTDWDLIFTEIWVPPDLDTFRHFSEKIGLYEREGMITVSSLRSNSFAGTSSYFVNKDSIGKVAGFLADNWKKGIPIDLWYRKLVSKGDLVAYVTVPFLTSRSPHSADSSIQPLRNLSSSVLGVYGRAFYKDADVTSLLAEMRQLTQGIQDRPLSRLYGELIHFLLSGERRGF